MAPINTPTSPQDGYDPVRDGELRIELWIKDILDSSDINPHFEAKVSLGSDAPDHALDWGVHYNHFTEQFQVSIYCDDIEVDLSGMVLDLHKTRAVTLDGRQPGGPRTPDQVNPARPVIPSAFVLGGMFPSGPVPHDRRSVNTDAPADPDLAAVDAAAPHEQFPDLMAQIQSCFEPVNVDSPPVVPSTISVKDDSGKAWAYTFRHPQAQAPAIENILESAPNAVELTIHQGMLMGCPTSLPTLS